MNIPVATVINLGTPAWMVQMSDAALDLFYAGKEPKTLLSAEDGIGIYSTESHARRACADGARVVTGRWYCHETHPLAPVLGCLLDDASAFRAAGMNVIGDLDAGVFIALSG